MTRFGQRYTLVEAHAVALDTRKKVEVCVCEDCGSLVVASLTSKHDDFHKHEHLTLGKIG